MSEKIIDFRVVYNRKNVLNKEGKAAVQIQASKDRERRYFDTGIRLKPDEWNEAKAEPSSKDKNRNNHLQAIHGLISKFKAQENKAIAKGKPFFVRDLQVSEEREFYDFIDFCKAMVSAEPIQETTKQSIKTFLNTLDEFTGGKSLPFERVTYAFLNDFERHLHSKQLNPNTIKSKHFKYFKKYMKQAEKRKLIEHGNNPLNDYKIKGKATNRAYLAEEEVTALEQLTFSAKESTMQGVRDMFLFQCYTGLRFSDVVQVTMNTLVQGKEGYTLHITRSQKTKKEIRLPLFLLFKQEGKPSKPEQLIERCKLPEQFKAKPIFGGHTEQTANKYLKVIAKRAGINKPVTTHVGRHTFATRLIFLVPLPVLRDLLQHEKIETTMIYEHVTGKDIELSLRRVVW